METGEEVRALTHEVVKWVVALELLLLAAAARPMSILASLLLLLLIRIIHSRCMKNIIIKIINLVKLIIDEIIMNAEFSGD